MFIPLTTREAIERERNTSNLLIVRKKSDCKDDGTRCSNRDDGTHTTHGWGGVGETGIGNTNTKCVYVVCVCLWLSGECRSVSLI